MSKAFVKDDAPAEEVSFAPRELTQLSENYITSQGFEVLRDERDRLRALPAADTEGRRRWLDRLLETATVIAPEQQTGDRVLFGATVTVLDEDEVESIYRIVGVAETDIKKGRISWISPLGRALLQARVGDSVTVRKPGGTEHLQVVKLDYLPIPF